MHNGTYAHPTTFFHLKENQLWWLRAKQGCADIILPSQIPKLLPENPEACQGQMGCVIPPVCSGSGSPPGWTCPEYIQREASCRCLDQMPEKPKLAPFNMKKRWFYSELVVNILLVIKWAALIFKSLGSWPYIVYLLSLIPDPENFASKLSSLLTITVWYNAWIISVTTVHLFIF